LTPGGSSTVHRYSTHLHTNSTQNTENRTYITIKTKIWELWPVPYLCALYPGICLTNEGKESKTTVRVVEKCPDIPGGSSPAHKQYTEQNIHNNKNT
jgi:hypothetical protein